MHSLFRLWRYGLAFFEVARDEFFRAPEILSKLMRARSLHGYGPDTFFLYDLHNRPEESWGDYFPHKAELGPLLRSVNRNDDHGRITIDKLLSTEKLQQAGVGAPPILAVIGRDLSLHPVRTQIPVLNGNADLESFLDRPECPGWLFSKPVGGQEGAGAFVAARHEGRWHVQEKELSSGEFAGLLLDATDDGLGRMLQPRMRNHPEVVALTANLGLSTLRVIAARTRSGVRPLAAVQKLIGDKSATDNFLLGATGNVVAPVDLETGVLGLCRGRKPGRKLLIHKSPDHPVSGKRVEGTRLPQWEEALETISKAAMAFPDQPLLGFDLALTENGPMILEANSIWSWVLPQVAIELGGKALFAESLRDLDATDEELIKAQRVLKSYR